MPSKTTKGSTPIKPDDSKDHYSLRIAFNVPVEAVGSGIDCVTIHFTDGHERVMDVRLTKQAVEELLRKQQEGREG